MAGRFQNLAGEKLAVAPGHLALVSDLGGG